VTSTSLDLDLVHLVGDYVLSFDNLLATALLRKFDIPSLSEDQVSLLLLMDQSLSFLFSSDTILDVVKSSKFGLLNQVSVSSLISHLDFVLFLFSKMGDFLGTNSVLSIDDNQIVLNVSSGSFQLPKSDSLFETGLPLVVVSKFSLVSFFDILTPAFD
jgi:hypothetical protein